MTTYLRIGTWNPDYPCSKNYAAGTWEVGLSVYELGPDGQPICPDGEWSEVDMRERLRSDEPKFIVQGDIIGEGHDGEPLLADPVIVGPWEGAAPE